MAGRVGMRMFHYGPAVAKIKNSKTYQNIHFFLLFWHERSLNNTPFATRCSNLVVVRFVAPALPS